MTATANLPAKRASFFNDDVLREIVTWDDLGNVVKSNDVLVNNLADYGPGLVVVANKDTLIGVPMMIVNYRFHEGDNGPFVSAVAITKNPVTVEGIETSKVVINDGSTGIFSQLQNIELQRVADGTDEIRPLYCPKGLRKSEYERKDENGAPILNERTGKPERATTYYLA